MQVLAETASRETKLQPQPQKQQLIRRIGGSAKQAANKQPGPPMPRIHTLNKAQVAGVNQLTSKQAFAGQKILSQQNLLNHKIQQQQQQQPVNQQKNLQQNSAGAAIAANQNQMQHAFKQMQQKQQQQNMANLNVLKSSSLPNIANMPKFPVNSNVVLTTKQQIANSAVQHVQQSSQMQLQQSAPATPQQIQRAQHVTGLRSQQITTAKLQQQHMLLKVGPPNKNHSNSQSGNTKSTATKLANAIKANQQAQLVQQQRNFPNSQGLTVVQHQQQIQQQVQQQPLIVGPQNMQKQLGCIKTLAPQKPGQKNHAQKNTGIKTSLNTNMNVIKTGAQGSQVNVPMANAMKQKGSIKTLLPQQSGGITAIGSGVVTNTAGILHKVGVQSIKIQQQSMQQKQLVMNAATAVQYTQAIKPQPSQIKTILPVNVGEPRRETELKIEIKTEAKQENETSSMTPSPYPQSPQRRMPLPYECLQFVLQDHNYGAPPPRTPPPQSPPPHPKQQPVNGAGNTCAATPHAFIFNQAVNNTTVEDDAASAISSEAGREVEPEGEETETAPEGEGDDEDSVTRCICDFEHDDGYMICCDRCLVWQHVDCMGIDRNNIPDEYLCEVCRPRRVDRARARALQMRKREELLNSDTTSDSSSTSSADTDVAVNTVAKNRKVPQQQQQSIPRRKSDPPQVRRLTNSNNNNVAKRQRRDTNPRQTNTIRNKKESTTTASAQVTKQQRGPGKRKTKRRASLEDKEDDTQDAWGSNMAPLRQWIERYEEAVTNHYSPELRARISSIKVNGTYNDLRQSNVGTVANGKCRLNIQSNSLRFLVATMYLPPNTPVVELRGKYMLSTQHRPSHPQGRQHTQRPGPFVFFYRLPRDGTAVCVDTRTYGNDARFVRRSCKPNAEVKHCIEKGTLHLYIVTSTAIEKNAEITIRHDQHDLMLSPTSNSSVMPLMCACNNPKDCQIANLAPATTNRKGSNGPLTENTDGRERRRRGRRNTVSEDSTDTPIKTTTAVAATTSAVTPPLPTTPTPVQPTIKKAVMINTNISVKDSPNVSTATSANSSSNNSNTSTPVTTRQSVKEEEQQPLQPTVLQQAQPTPVHNQTPNKSSTSTSTTTSQSASADIKKDKKKMTREERKMEAIMKAFERLEKAEQRKQEVQARNAQRKESGGANSDNDDSGGHGSTKSKQHSADMAPRRKRRKGRTSSTSQSHCTRRTRLNSAESDLTSGDESNSIQSPPLTLPNQNCSYSLRMHAIAAKDSSQTTTSQSGIPTAAGLLLALANSNVPGSSSPPQQQPTPIKSPSGDSGTSSSSQSSTPSTPLSSACLLVAAAVGPLAPGFKFPKTKKVLMNEWLKESPEPQSHAPDTRGPEFPCGPEQSSEFLSQNYAAKSLATLVQAAHSVSGICDASTQRSKQATSTATSIAASTSVSSGSAKKRWLRQAISEECDSPNSSRPESPPSEMLAPPKKRRIARESLSSDNYTPPTTPTMMHQDHMPTHRPSINEDDFVEHMPSPSTEDLGSQNEYDSDQVKDEIKPKFTVADETERKYKVNSPVPLTSSIVKEENQPTLITKIKEELKSEDEQASLDGMKQYIKKEDENIKDECKPEPHSSTRIKTEPCYNMNEALKIEKKPVKIEEVIQKGTVEIVDQNEQDLETDDLSSPIAAMESDAVLKQRVAELRLEFGGGIVEVGNLNNETEKSFVDQTDSLHIKNEEDRYDDNTSIDEFDVEAQMKKITGDDGDDYKEKVDSNSERDKSMDGIEGLMESSKEDSESDSEDKNIEDIKECNESFEKSVENAIVEERIFKEFGCKNKSLSIEEEFEAIKRQVEPRKIENILEQPNLTDKEPLDSFEKELTSSKTVNSTKETRCSDSEPIKLEGISSSIITSEESMMKLNSMELPSEEPLEQPVKDFASIPPLSERIRKKADTNPSSKSKLEIEASIIESSLDLELVEDAENGEEKKILSTALRELLEAKIEPEEELPPKVVNTKVIESKITVVPETPVPCIVPPSIVNEQVNTEVVPTVKKEEPSCLEPKRLKDPRTAVPNKMPATSPSKPDGPPPAKRKLSISEYRKRMQQSTGIPPEPENSETPTEGKSASRGRSDSASSCTSSLSSDDESTPKPSLDIPSLNTLPLFANADGDEKKSSDEGTIGWSAAPTLVERQRENLTERLKREFGLFLNDDEEERARKQGMGSDSLLKSTSMAVGSVSSVSYPVAQLPPQPYIPPPGSASIHYSQYPTKPTGPAVVQYPSYPVPPPIVAPNYPPPPIVPATVNQQQFIVPQAPPGSNPYPPAQFAVGAPPPPPPVPPPAPTPVPPPTTTTISISRFSPGTAQTAVQPVVVYPLPPSQTQKTFYNHPAPRS